MLVPGAVRGPVPLSRKALDELSRMSFKSGGLSFRARLHCHSGARTAMSGSMAGVGWQDAGLEQSISALAARWNHL